MIKRTLLFHGVALSLLFLAADALAQTSSLRITRMVPSNGVMHLTWTGGPAGPYMVQQRQGLQAAWVDVGSQTMGTSAAVPLSGPGPCFFRVKALTSDLVAPATPGNFSVVASSCTAASLSWNAATDSGGSGLRGYKVYRDGAYRVTVDAPATSLVETGLAANTTYTYLVRALDNSNNESGSSATVGVTTPSCSSPSVRPNIPSGLRLTSISCSAITVSWNTATNSDGSAVRGYDLYRDGRFLREVYAPVTSWNDTTVGALSNYSYRVLSFNSGSSLSAQSAPVGTNTPMCPDLTAPSVPGNVIASATGCSSTLITWSGSTDTGGSGLKGYNVFRGGAFLRFVAAPTTSTTDSGLAGGTSYNYAVAAVDNVDNSSAAGTSSTTTPACNLPPVAHAGPDRGALTGSNVSFSGSGSTDPDGSIMSYAWNFGDGGTGSGVSVSHAFASAGTYVVTLTVTDNAGASSSDTASVTLTNAPAAQTPSGDVSLAGCLPAISVANDLQVQGNVAYVACNALGLSIIDITTPSSPRLLGSSDLPFDGANIILQGSYAIVTGQRKYHASAGARVTVNGLYVLNVAVATNPVVVGRLESSAMYFNGLAASGQYAYVACGLDGVQVVDLSTPSRPALIGSGCPLAGWAWSVVASGSHLFVADGTEGLRVLSIANPAVPAEISFVDTPGNALSLGLLGSMVYIADGATVQAIDVSNRSAPAFRGSYAMGGANNNAVRVAARTEGPKNVAYVSAGGGGLVTLDMTTPSAPVKLGSIAPSGGPNAQTRSVALVGSTALLANYDGGLSAIGVGNPATPTLLAKFTQWFAAGNVTVSGSFAIATGVRYWEGGRASIYGLQIISKQDPTNPVVVGALESSTTPFNGLVVSGNYAYVACGLDGVKVVNLSDPTHPAFVGAGCSLPGWAWSIAISGNYLYVANGTEGLRVLSIANPAAPVEVGYADTPGNALSVSLWGTTAFVADGNSVQFISIATPTLPVILGSYAMGGGANTAVRAAARTEGLRTLVYIASGGGGLTIVDATVPVLPVKLGSLLPTGGPNAQTRSVSLSGSIAYVANADGGVGAVDVSSPTALRLVKSVLTPGAAQVTVLDGGWLYAGDSLTTLNSVRLTP